MVVSSWIKKAEVTLEKAGLGTARLDALVLLEDVVVKDRAWLLAHGETEIESKKLEQLTKLLNRRIRHEPLAYIRGKTEFYGRTFVLTPAVLEPRPESEAMIDLLKVIAPKGRSGLLKRQKVRIADVGAGSGAIGITAQLELPNTQVDLLEIDQQALKVAKTNVDKFTLNISSIESDLLSKSSQDYDILLCNLPYVPDEHTINQAAMREPKIAIFGGPDGLNLYRKLFTQIAKLRKKPLYILTESLPPQHHSLQRIAIEHGYHLAETDDFIQVFTK